MDNPSAYGLVETDAEGRVRRFLEKPGQDEITVNSQMETGRAGIYAAGDVTTYPGKLKLIALGFSEAAIAVNQAVHWIYPEKKVAPGHSSNMAVFGQKDD